MKKVFNDLSRSSSGLPTAKAYKDTVSLPFRAEDGIKKTFQQSANPERSNQPSMQKNTTFDTMATSGLINTEVTSLKTGIYGSVEAVPVTKAQDHMALIP